MTTYFDSSAIVKLYVTEAHSAKVSGLVRERTHPVFYTHLHDLEIRNGLRLKVFRKEAAAVTASAALRLIDEDISAGVLFRPELIWFDVFRYAEKLSKEHSAAIGSRSLDVLHVASALVLQLEDFVTFDERQAVLAKKAGLRIVDLL